MKKRFKEFEVQEEVRIPQDDHDIILEKGDRIQIIEESFTENSLLDFCKK